MARKPSAPPPPSDPDKGVWQGRSSARVATSPDGLTVLVGRTARDNDLLSIFRARSEAEGIGYQTLINATLRAAVGSRPVAGRRSRD